MNESKGDTSKSQTGIAGLDAIGVAVKPARDLSAVEVQFVDAAGTDCAVRLGRPGLIDLIVHSVDALMVVEGRLGAHERLREAQLLLQALIEPRRRKARWVAQRMGIGDSAISLWRNGKAVPTQARLDQLRELVKSIAQNG
jgi:hypothetical protein